MLLQPFGPPDTIWLGSGPMRQAVLIPTCRHVRENRVLLTFDKDFGELAWRAGLPATAGIVLFRLPMPSPADVGPAIASIIGSREDWPGQFSVVEPGRIRMRSLPSRS